MNSSQDIDSLITKYANDLMEMKEKWSKWGIVTQEEKEETAEEIMPETQEKPEAIKENTTEEEITQEENVSETPDESEDIAATPISDYPSAKPEFYANFKARVFSGDQAYPVEGAKVLLYLDGKLHTFLITNEDGETQRVKIESANAENALTPNSENQQLDYLADVYADGFSPRKGLLVSAVGGSDILLNVQLTPEPERID